MQALHVVQQSTPLTQALQLLLDTGVSALPVVNEVHSITGNVLAVVVGQPCIRDRIGAAGMCMLWLLLTQVLQLLLDTSVSALPVVNEVRIRVGIDRGGCDCKQPSCVLTNRCLLLTQAL